MQNLLKSDYQAFIFDMDGTIVSTVEDICDAVNYSLIRHDFMPISYEECTTYLGNGSVKLIQRAMHHERQELFQSVFDTYYNYYLDHYQVKTKPYDGLLDALAYAKSKGVLLFIYTNKPEKIALEIEKNLFPKGTFEKMVGIPLGGVTKPDPVAFLAPVPDFIQGFLVVIRLFLHKAFQLKSHTGFLPFPDRAACSLSRLILYFALRPWNPVCKTCKKRHQKQCRSHVSEITA